MAAPFDHRLASSRYDTVTRPHPAPLGDHHEGGEPDADHREHDMEAEGHGHLASRGEQVGHGGCDSDGDAHQRGKGADVNR